MSLEFEKKLGNELSKLGIHTQPDFRVPGTDLIIDFYITAPIRGLIEIKGASFSSAAARTADKDRAEQLKHIYTKFNKSIFMFLIIFGPWGKSERKYYNSTGSQYIFVPDLNNNPEKYCAQEIRRYVVQIATGLKTNEIVLRMKEKDQILNSISVIETEKENNQNGLYRDNKEIKYLYEKLESFEKNIQPSSSLSSKDERMINNLKVNIKHIKEDIMTRENNIQHLAKQHQAHNKHQATILLEIKSLQQQLDDLLQEDDEIIESDEPEYDISADTIESLELKKDKTDILSPEQAKNLEKTKFTPQSSFKVINIYRVAGEDFKQYFPHLKKWYKPMQVIETDKGWFIDATLEQHGSTEWKKEHYHNCRVTYSRGGKLKPLWLQKDNIFNRKPIDAGMFGNVLSSFQAFLSKDKFKVLVQEVADFNEEYRSQHYTTAAIRIGRTLEYVIYTLVTSWGVTVNQSSTSRIDTLSDSFKELCKHLIYYYTPEKGKKNEHSKNLNRAFDTFTTLLNRTQRELDKDHEVFVVEDRFVNIEALLRSLKTVYGRNQETREAIDNLKESGLISKSLSKRNLAAHADHSGSKREFNEEEVKEMAEDLHQILFLLGNIHETISRSSS